MYKKISSWSCCLGVGVLLLSSPSAYAACAGNLLQNPSFEDGLSDGQSQAFPFQGWEGVGFADNPGGATSWTFGEAYGAAGNGDNSGAAYQDVPTVAGQTFKLSFYAGQHEPDKNDGTVELQYLDAGKNPLGTAAVFQVEYQAGSKGWPDMMFDRDAPYELSLPAAPAGAAFVRTKITHTHNAGSGWDITKVDSFDLTCTESAQASSADLELAKIANPTSAKSGDVVHYTITVTNKGPDAATGVEITDQLPTGVAYKAPHTASQGTYTPATGIWAVGSIANGATVTLGIDAILQ